MKRNPVSDAKLVKLAGLKPVAGGENLEEHLANLKKSIDGLTARAAKGEDVSAELSKLESERKEGEKLLAEQQAGEGKSAPAGETELERLRREKSEREEREAAESLARRVLDGVVQEEAERQKRVQTYALDAVKTALGGASVEEAVKRVLQGAHGGNRFAGEGASMEALAALAAGKSTDELTLRKTPDIQVGKNRALEAIIESKNFSAFFGAISRNHKGRASELDRQLIAYADEKALAEGTGTAGGYLVPPDWMPDVLKLLRERAVVRRAQPRIVPFTAQMNQVSLSGGATAYYTAENAVITKSEETFGQATLLTPKNLTALVPVSNFLLRDTGPQAAIAGAIDSAEDMVRMDLAVVMALREDLAFLQGSGTGGEPTGIKNISGVTSNVISPGTNGFYPTLPQMRQIRNYTRRLNVGNPRWVWFFNPQLLSNLEQLTDSLGRFLADTNLLTVNEDGKSGVLDGVPFFATNQIPVNLTQGTSTNSTYALLVDMNELIVGINTEMEVDVSSEASYTPDGGTTWISAFQSQQTLFRTLIRHDINHRYPSTVIVQNGILV